MGGRWLGSDLGFALLDAEAVAGHLEGMEVMEGAVSSATVSRSEAKTSAHSSTGGLEDEELRLACCLPKGGRWKGPPSWRSGPVCTSRL